VAGNRPGSTEGATPFGVRLAPAARRRYEQLDADTQGRVRAELLALAKAQGTGARLGKAAKTLRGVDGEFHRLRVGDLRVMYDTLSSERVILVLGIVDRKDLERWLRNR